MVPIFVVMLVNFNVIFRPMDLYHKRADRVKVDIQIEVGTRENVAHRKKIKNA